MNRNFFGALVLAAAMTAGCLNRDFASIREGKAMALTSVATPISESRMNDSVQLQAAAPPPAERQEPQRTDRKLIRNGELTIEVKSVGNALTAFEQIVRSIGGQATNKLERQNEYGARTASITWLVPAEKLDAAIDAVRGLGEPKVVSLKTEDITTGYFDMKVRIDTQKQLERQLVALLGRATNRLSDLLEIEREVARVRQEIDQLEGHIRLWDNQIAMSSVAITLTEPTPIAAGTGGPFATLLASFGAAGENFVLTVAALVAMSGSALPLALLLAATAWLAARMWRRTRAIASPVAPQ